MNQQTLILVVRGIALLLVLIIIWTIWRLLKKEHDEYHTHVHYRRVLPNNTSSNEEHWDIQMTKPLNKGFFGQTIDATSFDIRHAPHIDLPLIIMARHGQHFSGEDIASLVRTFGLQRSPVGTYELINVNGIDILFSMLNLHAPGTFAENLEKMESIDGIILVMQLPNGTHALKSFETFSAMVNDMCDHIHGRLCDFERRPMGSKELLLYRRAAENFQNEFNSWLAQHQHE